MDIFQKDRYNQYRLVFDCKVIYFPPMVQKKRLLFSNSRLIIAFLLFILLLRAMVVRSMTAKP